MSLAQPAYPRKRAPTAVGHAEHVQHLELGGPVPPGARVVRREAVKAVVERDGLLLLLLTPRTGDHKLPGGGVQAGETHGQTLDRELREETGRALVRLGTAVLHVVERRADVDDPAALFEMTSTYYRAEVSDGVGRTDLDDYERDLGLIPVWTTPAAALVAHEALLASGTAPPWTARETEVLRLLLAGDL